MADPVYERAGQAARGPQRTWPDLRDVPARAKAEAERILGADAAESLRPAFDDDEEDTAVVRYVLKNQRAEIERLCREFTEDT